MGSLPVGRGLIPSLSARISLHGRTNWTFFSGVQKESAQLKNKKDRHIGGTAEDSATARNTSQP
jgi:hypothetical protein